MQDRVELSAETINVLLRSSPDCIKLISADGRLLFMSQGGLRSMEVDEPASIFGRAWVSDWSSDQQPIVAAALEAAHLTGSARFEGVCHTAKGKPRRWDVLVSRLDNEVSGAAFLVISRDATDYYHASHELEAARDRYRALLELATDICWRSDPEGQIIEHWGWGRFHHTEAPSRQAGSWLEAIHPDHREAVSARWAVHFARRTEANWEAPILTNSGEYRWMCVRCRPLFDATGALREWIGTATDVHERKCREEELRIAQERLKVALQAGQMVTWERKLPSGEVNRSENATELLGIARNDSPGFHARVDPRDREALRQAIEDTALGHNAQCQVRYAHPDGRQMWLGVRAERPAEDRLVGIVWDVSEIKNHEAELWRLANNDPLTGLPNRSGFARRIEEMIRADQTGLSLLLIDLDNFKEVNDTLGHAAGDQLLMEAARRLQQTKPLGIVARLGGDEFAVVHEAAGALELADRILERFGPPVGIQGESVRMGVSIGIAFHPSDGVNPSDLLKYADLALYEAKRAGKNRHCTFHQSMQGKLIERRSLLAQVKRGIRAGEFHPYYHPKIDLSTGQLIGFEALARWVDGIGGVRSPAYFADALDDHETSLLIGAQILDRVLVDMRNWRSEGIPFGSIAVNLSSSQLSRPDLATSILGRLVAHDLPPSLLEVEITESVFFGKDSALVSTLLSELADVGISIALDDFGTGFASLTHLKAHPVSHIKIDRSFIENLGQDDNDSAIVSAIVNLARTLKMRVTAEGVELDRQEAILRAMGCEAAQGHLYAKPMPASRVPWFVRARSVQDARGAAMAR